MSKKSDDRIDRRWAALSPNMKEFEYLKAEVPELRATNEKLRAQVADMERQLRGAEYGLKLAKGSIALLHESLVPWGEGPKDKR